MSIATVAPGAIEVTFSGRFGFGIYRWAYLPFDVPPGVQRIRVSHVSLEFSVVGVARNVLDLGIFGPAGYDLGNAAGFRGWSGGARDSFEISSNYATPGYLAGPIEPGTWAVALGPVVLSPWGMAWEAHVTMEREERSEPLAECEPVVAFPPPPSVSGARWYRGDLHLHTVHSDGQRDPDELAAAARASGLDFIVSTEHNTNAANRAWPAVPHRRAAGDSRRGGHHPARALAGCRPVAARLGGLAIWPERRGVSALRRRGPRSRWAGGRRPPVRAVAGVGVGVRL